MRHKVNSTSAPPVCVMVGPSPQAQGGVASVISVYADAGLFSTGDVALLESFNAGSLHVKLAAAMRSVLRYGWLLSRGHGAVLHVHVSSRASFWRKAVFIWMARFSGRHIVFHLHGGGFRGFLQALHPFLRSLALRTIRQSDEILCLTTPMAEWLSSIAPNVSVRWWPNPVPPELFEVNGVDLEREAVVLYLGALLPAKGLDDLIKAFVVLHQLDPQSRLLLAGAGPQAESLRADASRVGVEGAVEFLGWVNATQKARLLRRARVLVLPSHLEAQPMVLLEAMAAGLPILSTKVGGIPDLVTHGEGGLLVDAKRPELLAESLLRLWGDPDFRARLASSAKTKALQNHCAPDVCTALRKLYQSLATKDNERSK